MSLPKKFRYYHRDDPFEKSWSGVATVEGQEVRVHYDDGNTYTWPLRDSEAFVEQGVWVIVPDEVVELKEETTSLVFYYVGREDTLRKAYQTKDGFEVMWGGPLLNSVWYTTDQVKGFIAAGNWVVVGVE